ncbi:MAG: FixH family protein, partial [Candidatus Latescibacterota bacterium]
FGAYRWPIYLGALLSMSVAAQGVLVWVATRPDAPRPLRDYYQRSRQWDAEEAVVAASQQLGWAVRFAVPAGVPHMPGMPRPIDVVLVDRDGQPVRGLGGRLQALRTSDPPLTDEGTLTQIPHLPGTYRTLVRLDAPGVWEFRLEAQRDGQPFVHSQRVTLAEEAPASRGGGG